MGTVAVVGACWSCGWVCVGSWVGCSCIGAAGLPMSPSGRPGSWRNVDVEIQRIVAPVGNLRVDRGMKRGNKPSFGAYAGNNINQREAIVLSGGEGGIRRSRVVAVSGYAPAWRNYSGS